MYLTLTDLESPKTTRNPAVKNAADGLRKDFNSTNKQIAERKKAKQECDDLMEQSKNLKEQIKNVGGLGEQRERARRKQDLRKLTIAQDGCAFPFGARPPRSSFPLLIDYIIYSPSSQTEEREKQLEEEIQNAIVVIGNIVHDSVPIDDNEDNNRVERTFGAPRYVLSLCISHKSIMLCISQCMNSMGTCA